MSSTAAAELGRTEGPPVVGLRWPEYLDWLAGKRRSATTARGERVKLPHGWAPGTHKALIGTTGDGKTTHAVGILDGRKYVLCLDAKGEDDTLERAGYRRVRALPKRGWSSLKGEDQKQWREIWRDIDEGRPARVIVGGGARTTAEDSALEGLMSEAIEFCRHTGGWTLYVDELEILSSQRMLNLGPQLERMLIAARRDKTSVLTSFQAPAWVSKHATRQARSSVSWPLGDPDMIRTIANGMGRNWHEVAEAIDALPEFHTLTIPRRKHGGPYVIARAPELA